VRPVSYDLRIHQRGFRIERKHTSVKFICKQPFDRSVQPAPAFARWEHLDSIEDLGLRYRCCKNHIPILFRQPTKYSFLR
jgi:hypothetical protein